MSRYIDPFTDFGFKRLFGEEVNKKLLIDFLNSLLSGEASEIKELTYLKNEKLGRTHYDRKAVYDLYCESESGEKFIVELQRARQAYFKDRMLFYSTFPIQEQAITGEWNYRLQKVYSIGLMNFSIDPPGSEFANDSDCMHLVKLVHMKRNQVFIDKLTYLFVELPKFRKAEHELETQTDKWLYFLNHLTTLEEIPDHLHNQVFEEAFELAQISNFTKEQLHEYQTDVKTYRDYFNTLKTSFQDGELKGKLETAKRLLAMGDPLEKIAAVTGLSLEDLKKLKD